MLGFYWSRPERLPLAWRNQRTVLGLAFARSASLRHRPQPRCGTGIWPARDIAARRRHITAPHPSLPTALPAPPRTPAGKARLFDVGGEYPARHGLSAGGRWIRTFSTAARNPRHPGRIAAPSEPHPPLGSAQAGRERPVRRRRRRARDDAGVLCASDVLLRDPPGRQKLDQVAVIRGRDKSLPPGATCYARHSTTPICKKSFDRSSFGRVNCRFIIGRTISVLWREHQGALL